MASTRVVGRRRAVVVLRGPIVHVRLLLVVMVPMHWGPGATRCIVAAVLMVVRLLLLLARGAGAEKGKRKGPQNRRRSKRARRRRNQKLHFLQLTYVITLSLIRNYI